MNDLTELHKVHNDQHLDRMGRHLCYYNTEHTMMMEAPLPLYSGLSAQTNKKANNT